jgi:hypothetical protein
MTRYSKFLGQQSNGRCDSRSGRCGCGSNEINPAEIGAYPIVWALIFIIEKAYLQNIRDESVD